MDASVLRTSFINLRYLLILNFSGNIQFNFLRVGPQGYGGLGPYGLGYGGYGYPGLGYAGYGATVPFGAPFGAVGYGGMAGGMGMQQQQQQQM